MAHTLEKICKLQIVLKHWGNRRLLLRMRFDKLLRALGVLSRHSSNERLIVLWKWPCWLYYVRIDTIRYLLLGMIFVLRERRMGHEWMILVRWSSKFLRVNWLGNNHSWSYLSIIIEVLELISQRSHWYVLRPLHKAHRLVWFIVWRSDILVGVDYLWYLRPSIDERWQLRLLIISRAN